MRGIIILGAVGWLLTAVCGYSQIVTVAAPTNSILPYRTDRILIQPKQSMGLTALELFHSRHKTRAIRTFRGIHNLQVVQVPSGETVPSLIAKYRQSGLVDFAEPDYTGHVFDTTPNETAFANGTLWGLNTISAPQAWDVITAATNIVVAVVDTGVRYTHEDLAANMWVSPYDGSHGWNAINNNNNPSDAGTHGTMVAGVLGAVGNNSKGVVGVAWHVQIMACACFNQFGVGNVSDVITCLDYARTNGARIINASWGFTNSLALSNTIVSLHDEGIIMVTACGNNGTNIDVTPNFPSCYPFDNVVTVASTSKSDVLSTFSNYGATNVDLAAPGEQIYTTFPATDSFYYTDSGTSFSAPYVAGACALLMAQYPADSYRDIIARVLASTDPLPSLAGKCRTGGRLNLSRALRSVRLTSVAATSGGPFQFQVSGGLNRTCSVETSTDLVNWSPVYTNTSSTNGTFDFSDTQTANSPAKFYRATAAQ